MEEKLTWQQLKDFCNSLPEEKLSKEVLAIQENEVKTFWGSDLSDDLYIKKDDDEVRGSLEEVKEWDGDDFDINNYRFQPAGVPFLHIVF